MEQNTRWIGNFRLATEEFLQELADFADTINQRLQSLEKTYSDEVKHRLDVLDAKHDVVDDKLEDLQKTQQKLDLLLDHLSKRSTDLNELETIVHETTTQSHDGT